MKRFLISILGILIIVFILSILISSYARQIFNEKKWSAKIEKTKRKDLYASHKKDGKFFNPWLPMQEKNFFQVLGWEFSKANNHYTEEEKKYLPPVEKDVSQKLLKYKNKDYIVWIGHNTFLIKIGNSGWITDPMFSGRALLPKRVTPPAIKISELKKIIPDLNIIITHNHYDHLDEESIKALTGKGNIIAPLGLKKLLSEFSKKTITEMDWWQKKKFNRIEIICLPAQHWSRRIGQDVNTTLWASYLIITPKYKFYIGGDSGYFIGYKEFGNLYKDIDYAFLPITAYHPRWFMHYAHINVNEALMAFKDLKAKYFIPTQWGTFHLGDNPPGYPALELKRKIKEKKLSAETFNILKIGQMIEIKK